MHERCNINKRSNMIIKKANIYEIDEQLIVADTIEQAIAIYKEVNKNKDIFSVTLKEVDATMSCIDPFDFHLDLSEESTGNTNAEPSAVKM